MSNEKERMIWESDDSVSRKMADRVERKGILSNIAKEKQEEHEKFVEELEEQLRKYDKNYKGI